MDRRPHPADPRPADDHAAHQAGDAARLGLVGRRLQRRHRAACARDLLDIVHGAATATSCVPLQGSGTFSVEAAVATRGAARRPRAGARQRRLLQARRQADADDGPPRQRAGRSPRTSRSTAAALDAQLAADASITPRGADPLRDRHRRAQPAGRGGARCAQRHGKGLIVDAMSSFGALPIDARERPLRRAGRRQRQVPRGRAGHGLRVRAQGGARALRRQQPVAGDGPARPARLHGEDDQWRFTPPTHVVAALAEAVTSSSRKAASRRAWRATPTTAAR